MRSLAWLALLVTVPASAEMAYKLIGADGAVIYTDRPVPGAEVIRIPKPSSYVPRDLPVSPAVPETEPVVRDAYDEVRVTKPEQDGSVHAGDGGVDVDVLLQPGLQEGHTLTYAVDGNETAKGLRTDRVRITDLERGTHHIDVTVRDEGGAVVGRSPRVTFHVHRPSVNDPQRRDKGTGKGASASGGGTPAASTGYTPAGTASYKPGAANAPYGPATPASFAPNYTPAIQR